MKNLPVRKPNRLKNYDYSRNGAYFVTILVENRAEIFGKIENGKMILNEYGQIVQDEWLKTKNLRENVKLHEFVVMPNHFHAIVEITRKGVLHTPDNTHGDRTGVCNTPLHHTTDIYTASTYDTRKGVLHTPVDKTNGIPLHSTGVCNTPLRMMPQSPSDNVGAVVRGFKSAVFRRMHEIGWVGKIWHRSFHDHIIRDENDYRRIAEYIENNPQKWFDDCFYNPETE